MSKVVVVGAGLAGLAAWPGIWAGALAELAGRHTEASEERQGGAVGRE
jgi:hypothetical protein